MTFIIAEAGVNHNGDFETAAALVGHAKEAGADAVKFQYFSSQALWGDDRIKHLELDIGKLIELRFACKDLGIEFMCTTFGVRELEQIAKHNILKRIKIASGCIAKHDLLKAAKETGLPIILSTGMSTYADIREALCIIGPHDVTLLHCTSAYPCPLDQVNLRAMQAMRVLGYPVGYSDHTEGVITALSAAAMGATVIEKHITLDRKQQGPDHKASIDPGSFRTLVESIRQIEVLLGEREKTVQPSEAECYKAWR